jgi:hypothetical protein
MKSYAAFTELCLNHKIHEIHNCLHLLLRIAMTTDNGFFEEVCDREGAYLIIDNVLKSLDEAYGLMRSSKADRTHISNSGKTIGPRNQQNLNGQTNNG